MTHSVSVICTFLNAEQTLAPTLDSLRAQTDQNARFLLVDDGSSDGGPAIARRFCDTDPRFVLLKNPDAGRSRALNLGLRNADSPFVAILDADDVAHPEWLSDGAETLRQLTRFAVLGFERQIIRDLQPVEWGVSAASEGVAVDDVTRRLAHGNVIGHSGAILRRESLVHVGAYDEGRPYLVDYDLWIRLAERGHRIARSSRVRVAKRYHQDQKFGHRRGMRAAALRMQLRAVMAIDRSPQSFLSLGWNAAREFSRRPRRALRI